LRKYQVRLFESVLLDLERSVRLVCRILGASDPDNVCGDVTAKMFKVISVEPLKFESKQKLCNYAYTVAYNQVRQELKRDSHLRFVDNADFDFLDAVKGRTSLVSDIDQYLDMLPERKRKMLRLKAEGYSQTEIAEETGRSNATVSREVNEAIEFLKKQILQDQASPNI
jgi:RNA polymerase sigma factor (sigma-70 family)